MDETAPGWLGARVAYSTRPPLGGFAKGL